MSLLLSLWWYIGEQGKNSAIATVPKKLEILLLSDTVGIPFCPGSSVLLLTAEILHQLMDSLSHYLQGFIHPRWCRISAINSKSQVISRVGSFPHESFSATQGLNHNTKIFFVSAHSSRAFAHFFLGRTWQGNWATWIGFQTPSNTQPTWSYPPSHPFTPKKKCSHPYKPEKSLYIMYTIPLK